MEISSNDGTSCPFTIFLPLLFCCCCCEEEEVSDSALAGAVWVVAAVAGLDDDDGDEFALLKIFVRLFVALEDETDACNWVNWWVRNWCCANILSILFFSRLFCARVCVCRLIYFLLLLLRRAFFCFSLFFACCRMIIVCPFREIRVRVESESDSKAYNFGKRCIRKNKHSTDENTK